MALLKETDDILLSLDGGDAVLGLSSAFDTTDHNIIFHRLQSLYGISGTVLSWFESGRTQTCCNGQSSRPADVFFGVPQGSVLGPILFILY